MYLSLHLHMSGRARPFRSVRVPSRPVETFARLPCAGPEIIEQLTPSSSYLASRTVDTHGQKLIQCHTLKLLLFYESLSSASSNFETLNAFLFVFYYSNNKIARENNHWRARLKLRAHSENKTRSIRFSYSRLRVVICNLYSLGGK